MATTQAGSLCYKSKAYFIACWRLSETSAREHALVLGSCRLNSCCASSNFLSLLYSYYSQVAIEQELVRGSIRVTFVSLFSTFSQFIIWELIPPNLPRNIIWLNITILAHHVSVHSLLQCPNLLQIGPAVFLILWSNVVVGITSIGDRICNSKELLDMQA